MATPGGVLGQHGRVDRRPVQTAGAESRSRLDDRTAGVLRALGSGATDEAAARDLGMPLRTKRRRVAELLDGLDADSRFQAGVRAGERGLIRG
ncbi:hypothetical protein ACWD0Z_29745 [Streptomyces sp. NPDC003007]